MSIRTFVWPHWLTFTDQVVEEYGVWVDLPGILPIESFIELKAPQWWRDGDPIEAVVDYYRIEQGGVLVTYVSLPFNTNMHCTAAELMPDLIKMGWLHACQIWPSPVKEFTPPTFERADKETH